jgi:hypothetical protein
MAKWSEAETFKFIFRKGFLGLVLGCVCSIWAAVLYILVSAVITEPMDGSVTLGEIYDAAMNRYPQLRLAIGLGALLAAFSSILPVLINSSIPPFCPPIHDINRMFVADTLSGLATTIGYCAFGWVGFGVGCVVPFLVFPWHVRNL